MPIRVEPRESYVEVRKARGTSVFRLEPQEALDLARLLDEFLPAAKAGPEAWAKLREANPGALERGRVEARLLDVAVRLAREGEKPLSVALADLPELGSGLVEAANAVLGPRTESVWLREDAAAFLGQWRPRGKPHAKEPLQKIMVAMDLLLARLRREDPPFAADDALRALCARPRLERGRGVLQPLRANEVFDERFHAIADRLGDANVDLAVNAALLWAREVEQRQESLERYHEGFL